MYPLAEKKTEVTPHLFTETISSTVRDLYVIVLRKVYDVPTFLPQLGDSFESLHCILCCI